MKKITLLVIVLIIFNFIYSNFFGKVYAVPDGEDVGASDSSTSGYMSMSEFNKLDEGKISVGGTEMQLDIRESDTGSFASWVGIAISSVSSVFTKLMSNISNSGGFYYTDSKYSAKNTGLFTISSLVFGEYLLFNLRPTERVSDLNLGIELTNIMKNIDGLKTTGAQISQAIQTFCLSASVILVLYSIIRTVSAKKADDLAAWKKILSRWAVCLVLITFYASILGLVDNVSKGFVDAFWKARQGLENNDYQSFEITIEKEITDSLEQTGGVTSLGYSIEYFAIVILQVIFFVQYFLRVLIMILLYTVAPAIILIHCGTLMTGKQSDLLEDCFKTYIFLSFLQPFHALCYLILFFTLSEIVINVPVLGIFILYALYIGEVIVSVLFLGKRNVLSTRRKEK